MRQKLISFLLYVVISLLLTYPLLFNLSTKIIDDYDGLLITTIITQVQNNIISKTNLFKASFFYPYKNTLTYSDLFLSDALLTLPLRLITKEPIILFNISLLASLVLTAFFTSILVDFVYKDYWTAILAGLFASFSGFHLHYLAHLHTLNIYLLPLNIFFILSWRKTNKFRWLVVAAICFLLQTSNSFFTGFLIIAICLSLLVTDSSLRQKMRRQWKAILMLMTLIGLVLLPLIMPYLQTSAYFNSQRGIREAAHFSLGLEEIFTKFKSLTLTFLFLPAAGLILKQKKTSFQKALLLIVFIGLVLSLGPVLKINHQTVKIPFAIPLPYAPLYYLIPGFKGFRTPSRWFVIAGWAASILTSHQLSKLLKNRSKTLRIIVLSIIAVFLFMEAKPPLNFKTVPSWNNYPSIYSLISFNKNQGTTAILELPIYHWGMQPESKNEVYRMLFSLKHQQNLFNGYSGFFPPPWMELVEQINTIFPNAEQTEELVSRLKNSNIDYIIVHELEYQQLASKNQSKWQQQLKLITGFPGFKLIENIDNNKLYKIL